MKKSSVLAAARTRRLHRLAAVLVAVVTVLFTAPKLWPFPFSETKILIEVNATDEDAGIQIFVDAEGWTSLEVFDPNGLKLFETFANGNVELQGVTELFFESAEPSFDELPLDELFLRFPEGMYTFVGMTDEGKNLNGKAKLTHQIPGAPVILSPEEDAALDPALPVVVSWEPVTEPFPDTDAAVKIVGYQVIVEREKPQPLLVFSVTLPATVTRVTVPPEFLQANADYKLEVLAIEESGNQTISELEFTTE